jgi:hypothetical protein
LTVARLSIEWFNHLSEKVMTPHGSIRAALVCAAAILTTSSVFAQAGETYKARLTAVPADARTRAELTGIGNATAVLSGTKLTVTGSFEGLKSGATAVKIHNAVAAGVRGPALQELTVAKGMSGSITGSIDLNAEQLEHLKKGGLYLQIYTEKAPEGALWGWLIKQ